MKALTVAAALPALRLLVDAGDALVALADVVKTEVAVGRWTVSVEVEPQVFGAGLFVERAAPGGSVTLGRNSVSLLLGPVVVMALGPTAQQRLDCALAGPLGTPDDLDPLHRGEAAR